VSYYKIILTFVVSCILGGLVIPSHEISLLPNESSSHLIISYSWAGRSPDLIESQVTTVLEGVISAVRGVSKISSRSSYGSGQIEVTLQNHVDRDIARLELSSRIRQIYKQLPHGVSYPRLSLENTSFEDKLLATIQIRGEVGQNELRAYAEGVLQPKFSRLSGVSSVKLFGDTQFEWMISFDPDVLKGVGLNRSDIMRALNSGINKHHVGWVSNNENEILSVSIEPANDIENLSELVLARVGKRVIKLGNVASVKRDKKRHGAFFRINGTDAVLIAIYGKSGFNPMMLSSAIEEGVRNARMTASKGIDIRLHYDASKAVRYKISQLGYQSLMSFSILLLILLIFFDKRHYLFIGILGIATSVLLSSLLMFMMQVKLHLYSLPAILISTVISSMNICAALYFNNLPRSNSQFRKALFSANLAFCVPLALVWLAPTGIITNVIDFIKVILVGILSSTIVATWLIPNNLPKSEWRPISFSVIKRSKNMVGRVYCELLKAIHRKRKLVILVAFIAFGLPVFLLPQQFHSNQIGHSLYNNTLGSAFFRKNVRPYFEQYMGGTVSYFARNLSGSRYEKLETDMVLSISASLPNNGTIEQMNEIISAVENGIPQNKQISHFVAQASSGQYGRVDIYINSGAKRDVYFVQLYQHILRLTRQMSGVSWYISGVGDGFSLNPESTGGLPHRILLHGYDKSTLRDIAEKFKNEIQTNPLIRDIDLEQTPGSFQEKSLYEFAIDWDSFAIENLSTFPSTFADQLKGYTSRANIGFLKSDSNKREEVVLIIEPVKEINELQLEMLDKENFSPTRIGNISKVSKKSILPEIRKEDQQYIRQVGFNYMASPELAKIYIEQKLRSFRDQLPIGYSIDSPVDDSFNAEEKWELNLVIVIAIIMLMLYTIIFESLSVGLKMLSVNGLSFLGFFITFGTKRLVFDQGAFLAVVLIFAISSYLMVLILFDYRKQMTSFQGPNPILAYFTAFSNAINPIFVILSGVLVWLPFLFYGKVTVFAESLFIGLASGIITILPIFLLIFPLLLFKVKEI